MPLAEFEADFLVDADLLHAQGCMERNAGAVRKGDACEKAMIALMPQQHDQHVVQAPSNASSMILCGQVDGDVGGPIISSPPAMLPGISVTGDLPIDFRDQPGIIGEAARHPRPELFRVRWYAFEGDDAVEDIGSVDRRNARRVTLDSDPDANRHTLIPPPVPQITA